MSLIRPFLIGCATGLRSMSPLAVVSAVRHGRGRTSGGSPALIDHAGVSTVLIGLALLESVGDKLPAAPDRTAKVGIGARMLTGGLSAAALAPRSQRFAAAVLGASGAVGAAFVGVHLRRRAMGRFGRVATGLVEDAAAVGSALWLAKRAYGT